VDNQVQTPFQISDTADKNMRLAEVMGPEDKRANVTYADLEPLESQECLFPKFKVVINSLLLNS
jgi:hypothetical protein